MLVAVADTGVVVGIGVPGDVGVTAGTADGVGVGAGVTGVAARTGTGVVGVTVG